MASEVELIAKAEAVLDGTLAYQAAQAVHQLKRSLGIEIAEIRLTVTPMAGDTGTFRVVCTIAGTNADRPLKVALTVQVPPATDIGN